MQDDFEEWMKALENILESITEQNLELTNRSGSHGHLTEDATCSLHNLIVSTSKDDRFCGIADQLEEIIRDCEAGPSSASLLATLLGKEHIQEVLCAADDISSSRYFPILPEIPFEVDDDEGLAVKIVKIIRQDEPLGATIKSDENGKVTIARVISGSVVDRTGCIMEGDQVLEVNGVRVAGLEPREILGLLDRNNKGSVTFKLIPGDKRKHSHSTASSIHLRALFDYDGKMDSQSPCPEAALSFNKGDILELLVCNDRQWWQARNLGNGSLATGDDDKKHGLKKVGLVPSESMLVERMTPGVNRSGTLPRISRSRGNESDSDMRYESVVRLRPSDETIRPIVLIGASGVGRNELRRRLTLAFPDKFSTTIPHTSRQPRPHEQHGVDYYFVPKIEMENMIHRGEMLEFGEFKGNYYGTAVSAVRKATQVGIPLLTPHPLALKALRTKEFMPIIIFIQSPDKETFAKTRAALRSRWSRATSQVSNSASTVVGGPRGFTELEIEQIIVASDQLERQIAHLFDARLVNSSLETSFAALTRLIHKFESHPSWVPLNWATRDLD
ncbi:unnamed protein product, partial [Mesorhabditis belari]|uniref:MAGUK p55 subfamily member 7 n=1 Tax=Mesorhabditis belari TaxID=2138241 RepID=A0AAF3EBH0_9BILA